MTNLFDTTEYPEVEPTELIVGDTWRWKRTDLGSDYPPASYGLKYSLRLQGTGATEIEITASESGDEYQVTVAAATTANYTAGMYAWQAYIIRTSDSARITIGRGTVEVIANRDAATADPRSHWAIVLDACESILQGTASKEAASYAVDGVQLSRRSIPELMVLYDRARAEVAAEQAAEQVALGRVRPGRIVRTRFG